MAARLRKSTPSFLWDWRRDTTRLPFDASAGDARLTGCEAGTRSSARPAAASPGTGDGRGR